jgi:cell division control protein 6
VSSTTRLDSAKIGLVGVSTDSTVFDAVSSDTDSTLDVESVAFGSYDANQLREILRHRAEDAFVGGTDTVTDSAIALAAAHSAKEKGDARAAMRILRMAGNMAEKAGDAVVDEDHVEKAHHKYERSEVMRVVSTDLAENAKLAAYALILETADRERDAELNDVPAEPPQTSEVWSRYMKILPDYKDPVTRRQFRNYMAQFESMGLTQKVSKSRRTGGDAHELRFETGVVAEAFRDFADEIFDGKIHTPVVRAIESAA